jgi:LuxR family maltose regulon positive regulatory protein
VRGELVEIRAADLRFTLDESAAYLHDAAGLQLAPGDVEVLEERTEGWIAALQLAALSIQGREDVSSFIAQFAGNDRYIVDYLVEEVLAHQPEGVREFLLQTAVLDRLTGPLCDAVTGRDDGDVMLLSLERANLFLVALDDRREWYRYHHLFADVLRARLLAEQPHLMSLLHQRASHWYEGHAHTEEAVRHALTGRDYDRAARLIELAAPAIRQGRREATLYGWLKALPDDTIRGSPVLNVYCASMLLHSGDLDAVGSRLDDAERALAAATGAEAPPWADAEERRTLPATIAVYRASLAQARGDVTGTAEHARHALDLAGPHDHFARGGAAGFLGLAAWAQGDVGDAVRTFSQAVTSLHAAGNLVDELSGTVLLADMELAAGRPSRSRRLLQRGLQLADEQGESVARATAELHVGLSELDIEVNDLESAQRHLEVAAALADRAGMNEGRFRRFVASGLLARAGGDFEEALHLLDQAERLFRPGFYPDLRPIATIKARIWIAQGRSAEATDWARERGLSPADQARYLREYDHLTLVRLLLARQRTHPDSHAADDAVGLLTRLHEAAETAGRDGNLLEIRLLQALCVDAQGRRSQALELLTLALAKAPEPAGYVRLFLDEGIPLVSLLRDAAQQTVASDQVRRVLALAAPAAAGARGPATLEAAGLSARELQVLRLLGSELTGPQIARELYVSHNTLRTHTKHIFTKLEVTNRRAAVHQARERGLI